MKPIFSPASFRLTHYDDEALASQQANEIMQKLIESWHVVYGSDDFGDWNWSAHKVKQKEMPHSYHTHIARLAFIEELPKEACKHEPQNVSMPPPSNPGGWNMFDVARSIFECRHCGVALEATWKAKE